MFRAVPQQSLWLDALRLMRMFLALRQVFSYRFCQVCSFIVLVLAEFVPLSSVSSFLGTADAIPDISGAVDVSTEEEVRHDRRRKRAVITRRFVPLSDQQPGPVKFGSRDRIKELLEQAFDDGNI